MIHMILGKTFGFALKQDISNGTSAVDWWFAITNVGTLIQRLISSPHSTTETHHENLILAIKMYLIQI